MLKEDEIKVIAYRIWEDEGCPPERDVENWLEAEIIWEENHKIENRYSIQSN